MIQERKKLSEYKTWASSEELAEIYSTTKVENLEQEPKLQMIERNFCYNCQTDWAVEEIEFSLDGSEHCPACGEALAVPPVTNPWEIWP